MQRVAPHCDECWGVDVDPQAVAAAAALPGVNTRVVASRETLPFPDATFDTCTILDVIEHVADERATLCELARVSERIIVVDYGVPLPRTLVGLLARVVEMGAGPRHFAGFREFCRRGGLGALARQAGLAIEHQERLEGNVLSLCELRP